MVCFAHHNQGGSGSILPQENFVTASGRRIVDVPMPVVTYVINSLRSRALWDPFLAVFRTTSAEKA